MIAVTLLDVWVVYFILIKSGLLTDLPFFWWFPLWVMEFTFPLCIILTFENRLPVICYLFFVFGGEDTLYYLLTVGHMPERYIGIYFLGFIPSPAREVVMNSLALSLFLSFAICYVEYEKVKQSSLSRHVS
jgi:uncharacterized membrane protein